MREGNWGGANGADAPGGPGSSGRASRRRRLTALRAAVVVAATAAQAALAADVLTYKNDTSRTGRQGAETTLTPDVVGGGAFGKVFAHPVDGAIYAQPLVVQGVALPGNGTHDLVLVATEHDGVYAFDADDTDGANADPLWYVSFLASPPAGVTVTAIPAADVGTADLAPEIGITATPVVDPASGTLFVEAATKEVSSSGTQYVQRLHALDIATGAETLGGPVVISASASGTGVGVGADGQVGFDPLWEFGRAALLLSRGVVYVSFAAHGDTLPSHGWLLGYDAATLRQVEAFNTTPDGSLGSIWMSGGGPAADGAGAIYAITGNGTFDLASGGRDCGTSVLKLVTGPTGLTLADYFTPSNQAFLSANDLDLGSGGIALLPDTLAPPVHLAIGAGKDGTVFLLDRDALGGYNPAGDAVLQAVSGVINGCFSTPAVLGNTVYIGGSDYTSGRLVALDLSGGRLVVKPASQAREVFAFPGVNPSVTGSGAADGIVWAVENAVPAVLHAYLAADLGRELYASSLAAGDQPGDGVKFAVPTVANGRVYVGTQSELAVYGVHPALARVRKVLHTGGPSALGPR